MGAADRAHWASQKREGLALEAMYRERAAAAAAAAAAQSQQQHGARVGAAAAAGRSRAAAAAAAASTRNVAVATLTVRAVDDAADPFQVRGGPTTCEVCGGSGACPRASPSPSPSPSAAAAAASAGSAGSGAAGPEQLPVVLLISGWPRDYDQSAPAAAAAAAALADASRPQNIRRVHMECLDLGSVAASVASACRLAHTRGGQPQSRVPPQEVLVKVASSWSAEERRASARCAAHSPQRTAHSTLRDAAATRTAASTHALSPTQI
jgi:hypothetical protein